MGRRETATTVSTARPHSGPRPAAAGGPEEVHPEAELLMLLALARPSVLLGAFTARRRPPAITAPGFKPAPQQSGVAARPARKRRFVSPNPAWWEVSR